MLAALLPVFGPVLLMSIALGFSFLAAGSPQGAVPGACAILLPAVAAAASLSMLYRWCFPKADTRPAGMAAALVTLLMLFSSKDYLSLFSSPAWLGADSANLLIAARELALVGVLAVVAVMAVVLLLELPLRLTIAGWCGPSQEATLRSVRCVASFAIVGVAWLLLEESAVDRLLHLRQLLVR